MMTSAAASSSGNRRAPTMTEGTRTRLHQPQVVDDLADVPARRHGPEQRAALLRHVDGVIGIDPQKGPLSAQHIGHAAHRQRHAIAQQQRQPQPAAPIPRPMPAPAAARRDQRNRRQILEPDDGAQHQQAASGDRDAKIGTLTQPVKQGDGGHQQRHGDGFARGARREIENLGPDRRDPARHQPMLAADPAAQLVTGGDDTQRQHRQHQPHQPDMQLAGGRDKMPQRDDGIQHHRHQPATDDRVEFPGDDPATGDQAVGRFQILPHFVGLVDDGLR